MERNGGEDDSEEFSGDLEIKDKCFLMDLVVNECFREKDPLCDGGPYQCEQSCKLCERQNTATEHEDIGSELINGCTAVEDDFSFSFEKRKAIMKQVVHTFFEQKRKFEMLDSNKSNMMKMNNSELECVKNKLFIPGNFGGQELNINPLHNGIKTETPFEDNQNIHESKESQQCKTIDEFPKSALSRKEPEVAFLKTVKKCNTDITSDHELATPLHKKIKLENTQEECPTIHVSEESSGCEPSDKFPELVFHKEKEMKCLKSDKKYNTDISSAQEFVEPFCKKIKLENLLEDCQKVYEAKESLECKTFDRFPRCKVCRKKKEITRLKTDKVYNIDTSGDNQYVEPFNKKIKLEFPFEDCQKVQELKESLDCKLFETFERQEPHKSTQISKRSEEYTTDDRKRKRTKEIDRWKADNKAYKNNIEVDRERQKVVALKNLEETINKLSESSILSTTRNKTANTILHEKTIKSTRKLLKLLQKAYPATLNTDIDKLDKKHKKLEHKNEEHCKSHFNTKKSATRTEIDVHSSPVKRFRKEQEFDRYNELGRFTNERYLTEQVEEREHTCYYKRYESFSKSYVKKRNTHYYTKNYPINNKYEKKHYSSEIEMRTERTSLKSGSPVETSTRPKLIIDREKVDVEKYQDGLANFGWNPTQALYEICGKNLWPRPVFSKDSGVWTVTVQGQVFGGRNPHATKKEACHRACTECLHYMGFCFNYNP